MVVDTGANESIIRKDLAQNSKKIIAKPKLLLSPRTESIIAVLVAENRKHRFGLIDYPDPDNSKEGVLIASSVVDLSMSVIPVRVANISDKTRLIQEGELIAACAPVTSVDRKCNSQDLSSENLVKDLLQSTDLDERQRCAAGGLIKEFQSLFSRTSEDFGRTRLTKHRIDTEQHPSIKQHPRRLSFAKQEEVQKLINDMKDNDVIKPSSSRWASNIVLVKKKDGSTRFCVDYHLKSGYWQVELHPDDKEKTALTTGQGLWQSKVMPFSLWNAPATFKCLMETVLVGLSYESCLVYLDDIIIVGRSFEEHLKNIRRVLQKLKEANLKLSPSKCHLFQREVAYLGHIISAEGDALTSASILAYPEIGKQFILGTDASHESIGAVLCQEIDGQERVIAYFSKCLSKPERNYCVTRMELLAIVKAVEHFHRYLYGRRFLRRTDYASLTRLLNFKNPEG
ncbi:retrovirus-related Pol polyprotein from transposon 297 [Trichonephila clavipes]|nr:retrovirus-related Pol polyprotein from transposon 297 [Trichonephila clavipes]